MKILASDFDNTIYFLDNEEVTKRNVQAIKDFINQGNAFCLITGRTYVEIKEDLLKIDLPYSYIACGDGALIFDNTDFCLQRTLLDQEIVEEAVRILKENDYEPYLDDGYNTTTNTSDCIKVYANYIKGKPDAERVVEILNDELMVYAYASRAHINVNNPKNNKREAIKNIAKIANYDLKDIYVIGDSINDYEMLEEYNGAVVKNHNTSLDRLKLPVYDTVADYIEELSKN